MLGLSNVLRCGALQNAPKNESMFGAIPTIITAVVTFAATNIDDLFILLLFFSQTNQTFRPWHIVVGQYLGFVTLIALSLLGFIGSLVIPSAWIGLLGFAPILLGLQRLWGLHGSENATSAEMTDPTLAPPTAVRGWSTQSYGVATVTFANGGDNIGVYSPVFASSTLPEVVLIVTIFLLLVAVWCYVGWRLTQQPLIAKTLTRYGGRVVPFVLIGLGVYILVESDTVSLFGR
jgi:cadmium resistance transport/sequestration family protein